MDVCVVGGAGFLGSHMAEYLLGLGHSVLVVDNLVVGRREFVPKGAAFAHADITGSEHHLRELFKGCHRVYNYAAYPYVPDSYAHPLRVFEVNAFGALQVINAAQDAGVERILQVSSAELYGAWETNSQTDGRNSICESDDVAPHSSYGAAKAAIDAMVQVRWREAKTPCIALRQFNCVGERETHPYVVPEVISQLLPQQLEERCDSCKYTRSVKILHTKCECGGRYVASATANVFLGNNSFRDFMYAGDAVRMAYELLEKGKFGEVYNLGSEEGVQIYDLAKRIGRLMGFSDVQIVRDEKRVRAWEIWHLQSDNTKLYSLGIAKAEVSLEEALKRTIQYEKTRAT